MVEIFGINFNLPTKKPHAVDVGEEQEAKIIQMALKIDEAIRALNSGFYFDEETGSKIPLSPLVENVYRVIIFQHLPPGVTKIQLGNGKVYTNPRINKNELDDTQTWTMDDMMAYLKRRYPKGDWKIPTLPLW